MRKIDDNTKWVLTYILMVLEKFADSCNSMSTHNATLDLLEKIYDDLVVEKNNKRRLK